MTLEILTNDMTAARKAGDAVKKQVLSNMIDVVQKASMMPHGRAEITEALVDAALIKYQKAVQEQYDTCPDSSEDPKRDAVYKQRKASFLAELDIVKQYAPQLLTDYAEVQKEVLALLSDLGQAEELRNKANRGAVMKIVAPALKGKADMSVVNKVIGDLLA